MATKLSDLDLGHHEWDKLIVFDQTLGQFTTCPLQGRYGQYSVVEDQLRNVGCGLQANEIPRAARLTTMKVRLDECQDWRKCFLFARIEDGKFCLTITISL